MFTKNKVKSEGNSRYFTYECFCLSTDDKQTTGITNGSYCLEMDTKDLYIFDEDNATWIKQ